MAEPIRVEGLDDVRQLLQEVAKTSPTVAQQATNDTLKHLYGAQMLQMAADLDRPTPFARRAVRYDQANELGKGGRLMVWDQWRGTEQDAANFDNYLGLQMIGGTRTRLKGIELKFQAEGFGPKGMVMVPLPPLQRDVYGNVSNAMYTTILNGLKRTNEKDKGRGVGRFIYLKGDKYGTPSIWRVMPDGGFEMLIAWMRPRDYRARFDFYGRADREIAYAFATIWPKAVDRAFDKLKSR
jgi:hypothetical protein